MTHAFSSFFAILLTLHWGLGFPGNGKPPVGNAPAEHLRQFDAVYMGDPEEKTVYLTFDAGYENGNMQKILDTLQSKDVKAAFFVVGHYVEASPDMIRRMAAEGHIIANHTKRHPDMSKITDPAAFRKELDSLDEMVKQVTGAGISRYYRPPSGKYSDGNLKMAQKAGYKTVFWSLAYVDWLENRQPAREQALRKLTGRIHPGAILLLHSTSSTNAEILGELIDQYRAMGYSFGTLDELFAKSPTPPPAR
ncbi:MAG: polysaccharide deacetylase family protein [Oscillospiraceae bacterium]|jgi:peptidoglycan-N-acetylmuramic acid deacetylase|nr:polysaccharide deacetylase family protein [Oscillospiraceae bacterium]